MKKLLIVVDYQNDFVDGSLGFHGAEKLENAICTKVEAYLANRDAVVYTLDTHGAQYLCTREGKCLPVAHCLRGTEGWKPYGRLEKLLSGCVCLEKNTFGSTALLRYLEAEAFDEIELCGVVTNMCVLSNAVIAQAAQPEAEIVIDAQAVGSFDAAMGEKALDVMESMQMRVINRT